MQKSAVKGAVVKARTIGGLEAVLYELAKEKYRSVLRRLLNWKIRFATYSSNDKPEHRFLIGLSVEGNDQVQGQLEKILENKDSADFHYLQSDLIHQITEQIDEVLYEIQAKL